MQITIIGGGSYQWTPTLVADILREPSLAGVHLVLEDIDPRPLAMVERFAHVAREQFAAPATITATTDQQAALDGADFVVVTISTGGFASMTHDLEVPARYGIRQSVGDTVGPGGISRALRNVPVLLGIARDMERRCPDAWLLNLSNPMSVLTRAVRRETGIRAVGLCHEVAHLCMDVAATVGVPVEEVTPTMVGVNHLPVVTALDVAGADGLALLREFANAAADGDRAAGAFAGRHRLKLDLLDRFGALPAAGDRHVAEFLPDVLTADSGWGALWGISLTSIADREGWQRGFEHWVSSMVAGEAPAPARPSGEMVAPIVDSLTTGTDRTLPLNVPNDGAAPFCPAGVVVETMCGVGAGGVRAAGPVTPPPFFAELINRHVAVQELVVDAAVTGDRDLAVAAMLLDPLAGRGDPGAVERMTDELLEATAAWLPQFGGSPA